MSEEEKEEQSHEWRSDPAALLVLWMTDKENVDIRWVFDALGCWGYVTPKGDLDVESAKRAVKAIYKDRIYDY